MIKIVICGPECSGKTTLAQALTKEMGAVLVPELSRSILSLTGNQYEESDLEILANDQWHLEQTALALKKPTICDTSILEYKIWAEYRFGRLSQKISDIWDKEWASLWVLCEPLPIWIADGLRVNENERTQLYECYLKALHQRAELWLISPASPVEHRVEAICHFLKDNKNLPYL